MNYDFMDYEIKMKYYLADYYLQLVQLNLDDYEIYHRLNCFFDGFIAVFNACYIDTDKEKLWEIGFNFVLHLDNKGEQFAVKEIDEIEQFYYYSLNK